MRLIFAPDSFKGSLSAGEQCHILTEEARRVFPRAKIITVPMADGGEGTVDALLAACGGHKGSLTVTGPEGSPVEAAYAILPGGAAVMEMAQCSGLPLMARPDPLAATSFGTGEMLRALLEAGVTEITIGLGGSATNDGGMGLLIALGAAFFDENGQKLSGCGASLGKVATVDFSGIIPVTVPIHVMADVTNPLLGPTGATYVYGPQKGVTADMLPVLEAGMAHYADVMESALGRRYREKPGSGAAGGLGFALGAVLGADILPGTETMLRLTHLAEKIPGAALMITGEGRLDGQSLRYGKVCGTMAALCQEHGVPCAAIVGGVGDGGEDFPGAALAITDGPMTLQQAVEQAETLYRQAARNLFRMMSIGYAAGR